MKTGLLPTAKALMSDDEVSTTRWACAARVEELRVRH